MQSYKGTVNMNRMQPPMISPMGVPLNQGHRDGNVLPDPEENGRGRLPGHDPMHSGYAMNFVYKGRPLSMNDIKRPVFVNHYYAGEPLIPLTSKRLIKLDECDEMSTDSSRGYQMSIQP